MQQPTHHTSPEPVTIQLGETALQKAQRIRKRDRDAIFKSMIEVAQRHDKYGKKSARIMWYELDKGDESIDCDVWWEYPAVNIDYTKLSHGQTELPIIPLGKDDTLLYSIGNKLLFRLHPRDPTKLQVVDEYKMKDYTYTLENSKSGADGEYDQDIEVPINCFREPFVVPVGSNLEAVIQLFKMRRLYKNRATATDLGAAGRIRIDYGDVNTMRSWEDNLDVEGYVGATTGVDKHFMLIHNSRSLGGSPIMVDNILSIRDTRLNQGTHEYDYHFQLDELFTNPLKKIV